jgi:hypothetical protein
MADLSVQSAAMWRLYLTRQLIYQGRGIERGSAGFSYNVDTKVISAAAGQKVRIAFWRTAAMAVLGVERQASTGRQGARA